MKSKRLVATALMISAVSIAVMAPLGAWGESTYYSIKVKGGPDGDSLVRLQNFYARLLAELKVSDLGFANIGCDKCEKLDGGGPPITALWFVMEPDAGNFAAFASSYHYVQTNWHHEMFTMAVDGTTPAGACPSPLPTGCAPRTICIQTSSCDKPFGQSCQKCE